MNGRGVKAMKRHALGAGLVILTLVAITGYARATRGGNLSSLCERLDTESTYRVERNADGMHLIERNSGRDLCLIRQEGPESIVISSLVARIDLANGSLAERTRRTISSYNLSLSAGTLLLDENTGAITMIHYLNPRSIAATEMVEAIDHFGSISRTAAGEFTAMARR
jgi:hypothetical protein